MEIFYYMVFGVLLAVVALLGMSKTSKDQTATSSAFTSSKNNYLLVCSLMMVLALSSMQNADGARAARLLDEASDVHNNVLSPESKRKLPPSGPSNCSFSQPGYNCPPIHHQNLH